MLPVLLPPVLLSLEQPAAEISIAKRIIIAVCFFMKITSFSITLKNSNRGFAFAVLQKTESLVNHIKKQAFREINCAQAFKRLCAAKQLLIVSITA
jgi:hypothetical protein